MLPNSNYEVKGRRREEGETPNTVTRSHRAKKARMLKERKMLVINRLLFLQYRK